MCENEPYRMLKNWSYEMEAQELADETQLPPHDLDTIAGDVVRNLSKEIDSLRNRRENHEVFLFCNNRFHNFLCENAFSCTFRH